MGYQTKVQLIKRAKSEQWYINLPAQLAQAMEFEQSETVEWFIEDKATLALRRLKVPDSVLKKKRRKSSTNSTRYSIEHDPHSNKNGFSKGPAKSP